MKCTARNLKVREQELTLDGCGVQLADLRTKQYNLTVTAVGDDGRRLELALTEAEVLKIIERHKTQEAYNRGDFTSLHSPPIAMAYRPELEQQRQDHYKGKP